MSLLMVWSLFLLLQSSLLSWAAAAAAAVAAESATTNAHKQQQQEGLYYDLAAAKAGQANLVRQLSVNKMMNGEHEKTKATLQARRIQQAPNTNNSTIITSENSSTVSYNEGTHHNIDWDDTDMSPPPPEVINNASLSFTKDQCAAYCPCNSSSTGSSSSSAGDAEARVLKLRFLNFEPGGEWLEPIAREFEAQHDEKVVIEFVYSDIASSADEALNEAKSQLGFYDGFFTFPSLAGEVLQYQGWADLTDYVTQGHSEEWTDILLGYRQYIAQYEDRILMFPLDGDSFSMFYRKDVLEAFDLKVPRTWEEYISVARQTHGQVFENKTLSGSCLGRAPYCTSAYYAINMLASLTQTQGAWQGFMFDTEDMSPLLGKAMELALKWQEETTLVGSPNEFDACIEENKKQMNTGECTLTINWGNSFKGYLDDGDFLKGRLGVAPTPGSTRVLDRKTGELVPCTEELCKYATHYPDIGLVNAPPYLAFGGFACAVNNYTTPQAKKVATDFCAFTASTQQSIKGIIPPAGSSQDNGQDPFRLSHLDVERYVAQGYERDVTNMFIDTVKQSIDSENVVVDDKFPVATSILFTTDYLVHNYLKEYLNETTTNQQHHQSSTRHLQEEDQQSTERRQEFVSMLTDALVTTIEEYDALPTTQTPTLEAYQRLRGVYNPPIDLNQITASIRAFGYALVGIIFMTCCLLGGWTIWNRQHRIVRASQPFFLVMITTGAFIFGSAIIPLGIDDSKWSVDDAAKACRSVPWLLAIGFTTAFAALMGKISRINIVFQNASKFRRVRVTERDVLMPFGILIVANTILLTIWTIVDPLEWKRISVGEYSSYGTCAPASAEGTAAKVLAGLVIALNGIALILANVEAYKSRHVDTEFNESSSIAMAMGFILQIVLVGVPTMFLVDENPTASYFVRCTIVFIIAMSLLLFIFVPKVMAWYRQQRSNGGAERSGRTDSTRGVSNRNFMAMDGSSGSNRHRSSNFGGLKMKIYEAKSLHNITAGTSQMGSIMEKVDRLEALLREEGLDADDLLQKAGLRDLLQKDRSSPSDGNTTTGAFDSGPGSTDFGFVGGSSDPPAATS